MGAHVLPGVLGDRRGPCGTSSLSLLTHYLLSALYSLPTGSWEPGGALAAASVHPPGSGGFVVSVLALLSPVACLAAPQSTSHISKFLQQMLMGLL